MNFSKKSWLGLALIICCLIYFPALFHFPRAEHNPLLYEVSDTKNIGELISSVYRHADELKSQPEQNIFKYPLSYLLLSLEFLLFKYHFFFWQLISLIFHLMVVWQLAKLLNRIFESLYAFLFALNFSLVYVVQEAVIWAYVSPFLLETFLILAALNHLIDYIENGYTEGSRIGWGIAYLTVASFIDYFAVLASLVFIAGVLAYRPRKLILNSHRDKAEEETMGKHFQMALYFTTPIAIFYLWQFLERWGKPAAVKSHFSFDLYKTFENLTTLFWSSLASPFFPYFINIKFPSWPPGHLFGNLNDIGENVTHHISDNPGAVFNFILIFVITAIIIAAVILEILKRIKRDYSPNKMSTGNPNDFWIMGTASALLIAYIIMIVITRLNVHGPEYLNHNLFFLYPSVLFGQVLIYSAFAYYENSRSEVRSWVAVAGAIVIGISVLLNGSKNFMLNQEIKNSRERLLKERAFTTEDYYRYQKFVSLGIKDFEAQQYDAASENLKKADAIYPGSLHIYRIEGKILAMKGQPDQAMESFNKALSMDSSSWETLNDRGFFYLQNNQVQNALEDFSKSLEINPDQPDIYNARGQVYYQNKQYEEAMNDYNQALDRNPFFADALYNRGVGNQFLNLQDFALQDFTRMISIDSENPKPYARRLEIYMLKQNYKEAYRDCTKLLRVYPESGYLYYQMSKIYRGLGMTQRAEEDFLKAKELGYEGEEN